MVVTVETDIGITGVAKRSRDTLEQLPETWSARTRSISSGFGGDVRFLVLSAGPGEDPRRLAPGPGAVGYQGKALKLPVHQILGGSVRKLRGVLRHGNVSPGREPAPEVAGW